MAACDYRLCDVCGAKAFYDANLNYEWIRPNSGLGLRNGGEVEPGLTLDRLGDWGVLCTECAKTHEVVIRTRQAQAQGSEAAHAQAVSCEFCGGRGFTDDGHVEWDGKVVSAPEDCVECDGRGTVPAAHVQAGEGADVQRLRAVVVRNGAMVYPHLEDDASGNLVTYSDYAALRARIAELEEEIRAKDRAGQMALDKLAELSEQLKAAEARNAASERDAVLVPREATSKMMDRAVAAMHAAPVDWRGRQGHAAFRAGYAAALDAAIDAHAQGQAGEEKDG